MLSIESFDRCFGKIIPKLESTRQLNDPTIECKFYETNGNKEWYVIEGERVDNDYLFYGIINDKQPTLNNFSFKDLQQKGNITLALIFKPRPLSTLKINNSLVKMNYRILAALCILCLSLATSFLFAPQAHAFSLGDVFNSVKNFISPQPINQKTTINSQITLAPGGDANNNGQIDAGDTVRFTFTITNTTNKTYPFATIKTNINRQNLAFINNVQGSTGIDDSDGKTITIPNIRLLPNQTKVISFDSQINYFQKNDVSIGMEPELFTQDNSSLFKEAKHEIIARKISPEKFNALYNIIKTQ